MIDFNGGRSDFAIFTAAAHVGTRCKGSAMDAPFKPFLKRASGSSFAGFVAFFFAFVFGFAFALGFAFVLGFVFFVAFFLPVVALLVAAFFAAGLLPLAAGSATYAVVRNVRATRCCRASNEGRSPTDAAIPGARVRGRTRCTRRDSISGADVVVECRRATRPRMGGLT